MMSLAQAYQYPQDGPFYGDSMSYWNRDHYNSTNLAVTTTYSSYYNDNYSHLRNYGYHHDSHRYSREYDRKYNSCTTKPEGVPPYSKNRKCSTSTWEGTGMSYQQPYTPAVVPSQCSSLYGNGNIASNDYAMRNIAPSTYDNRIAVTSSSRAHANAHSSTPHKCDRSIFEDDDDHELLLSRDEIERLSPSRKDGIDAMHEAHLRYSYCAFLKNLGFQLELPQTTIATAMVLCHRFFVRRSHACHNRFLIATAALFLAAKSEETPCPLNNVLRASSEMIHNRDFTFLLHTLPVDWFEQYRERVIEAEEMILTTLNFELNVQHPYASLTSTLEKLGFSQSFLVNLALSLVSEGLRSSLWLQFKPQQIAAGAAYLAAKFLNMDLASYHKVWKEFDTPPHVLKDIAQQLLELF